MVFGTGFYVAIQDPRRRKTLFFGFGASLRVKA